MPITSSFYSSILFQIAYIYIFISKCLEIFFFFFYKTSSAVLKLLCHYIHRLMACKTRHFKLTININH